MRKALVVDANDVKAILAKHFDVPSENVIKSQYSYTVIIRSEGLRNDYGANIGSVLLEENPNSIKMRAVAMEAAAFSAYRIVGWESIPGFYYNILSKEMNL